MGDVALVLQEAVNVFVACHGRGFPGDGLNGAWIWPARTGNGTGGEPVPVWAAGG